MTEHSDALHGLLASVQGQWIEAVDADGSRVRLVTSRGAVLRGTAATGDGTPVADDPRLVGAVVTATTLAPDGVLTLLVADVDDTVRTGAEAMVVAVGAPWTLALPRGAGLAAATDGQIGVRPESGPRVATEEAMHEWSTSLPDDIELEVLDAAVDDWVTPADVVSALVRAGVREDGELARAGIGALARLVARGDLMAGTIEEDGFHPVPESRAEVVEHVATVWGALGGRRPGPGQVAWFSLTPEGEGRLRDSAAR